MGTRTITVAEFLAICAMVDEAGACEIAAREVRSKIDRAALQRRAELLRLMARDAAAVTA